MDFNNRDSSSSEDEIINIDDLVASLKSRQQQLQEEIEEGKERILEKQEEGQDLDKMIQIGELSLKDVLSELKTPVNSDSEEDEVRCAVNYIYTLFSSCFLGFYYGRVGGLFLQLSTFELFCLLPTEAPCIISSNWHYF